MVKFKKKVLLVNLPFEKVYEKTSLKGVAPSTPPLGIACIGATLLEEGHEAKIFDFNLYDEKKFIEELKNFNPEFVGISFVTPLIKEAEKVNKIVKDIDKKIITLCGGPHASSFPESSLKETGIDIAVVGEGDYTILDVVNGKKLEKIKGIAFMNKGKVITNKKREFIQNLDELPFPALHLYEIEKYKVNKAIARNNPVAWLETSRGCPYGCIYCNKSIFSRIYRTKSPERVVEEFKKAKEMGFKEIHITDDGFTTDMERAEKICDLLIKEKVNIGWSTITGIRVDRVNPILLKKMKLAGCYMVYYGIESGNQKIIENIKKGITLQQVKNAVKWSKEAGLEVAGFFMIGLPGETEKTMQETIEFAKSLDLDLAKINITIPLPNTEMFNKMNEKKLIKTLDWEKFKFYSTPKSVYEHENLSWEIIEKYYNKFYRKVYLNPRFLLKKIRMSIKQGTLIDDLKMALTIRWV